MKIHIHLDRADRSATRLVIDGQDVTKHVLAAGFSVNADPDEPSVSMTLRPDVLDIDGDLQLLVEAARAEATEADR